MEIDRQRFKNWLRRHISYDGDRYQKYIYHRWSLANEIIDYAGKGNVFKSYLAGQIENEMKYLYVTGMASKDADLIIDMLLDIFQVDIK